MSELTPDAKALIRSARGGDDPTPAERAEILLGFRAQRAALEPAERGIPSATAHRSGLRSGPRLGRTLSWSLAAVVLTGSIGAFAHWSGLVEHVAQLLAAPKPEAPEPAEIEPTPVRRGRATPPKEMNVNAADVNAADVNAAQDHVPVDVAPRRSTVRARSVPAEGTATPSNKPEPMTPVVGRAAFPDEPPTSPSTSGSAGRELGPELALIVQARDALAQADYARVRTLTARHAREFPAGTLALERHTILALADCRQTRDTRRARNFVRRWPGSLFAPRIARDCGLPSNSVPEAAAPATHIDSAPDQRGAERTFP